MTECGKILRDAVGAGEITSGEAEQLVVRMKNRAELRARLKGGNPFEKLSEIAGEMAMEANLDLKLKERNQLLDLSKRIANRQRVDKAMAMGASAADGILSLEIGSVKKFEGALDSADIKSAKLKKQLETKLRAVMESNGTWHGSRTEAFSDELVSAFDNPDKARPEVKELLKAWDEVMEYLVGRENRSGASIGFLEDWRVPQVWDTMRLRTLGVDGKSPEFIKMLKKGDKDKAFGLFRELMKGRLDQERTYKGMDEEKYLRNVFNNIYNDKHDIPGEIDPLNVAVKVHGGAAQSVSQPRKLHFKSAADWWAVHKAIGRKGSVVDLMIGTISRHSHNVAVLETWGPGGLANRQKFIDEFATEIENRPDSAKHVDSLKAPMLQASWNVFSGASTFSARPAISRLVDSAKVVSRLSTMGGSGLTAFITDKGFMQRSLERVGMPRLDALSALIKYSAPKTEAQKKWLRMYLVGIEGNINSIASRFADDMQVGRALAKIDEKFWRVNMLEQVTFSHKNAVSLALSNWAAQHGDLRFSELPEDLRASFEMSGMDAELWDIYRTHGTGESPFGMLIAEDRFAKIPDSAINALVEKRGLKVTATNRLRVKDEINDKWREWLMTETRFGVPEGTAREQALWMGNQTRGSWQGEVWSMLGMLKAFPLAIVNTVTARDLYAGGAGKMSEAIFSMNKGYADVAFTVAYTTLLGYTSWTIKNALAGKGAPPLQDENGKPNVETLLGSMTRGGGLGILGDFTLQEYDSRYRHWLAAAAGPLLGQVDTVAAGGAKLIRGESPSGEAVKLLEANTPFINLFYLRWALNLTFLSSLKEATNPGVLERQREAFEKAGGTYNPILPVFDTENRWRTFE